jgi:hypothetical protein
MKIVELLDETVLEVGKLKAILNNKDWSWDIYSGDKLMKSFKFKDADDRDDVEKTALNYMRGLPNPRSSK